MKYKISFTVDDATNKVEMTEAVDPYMDLALLLEAVSMVIPLAAEEKGAEPKAMLAYAHEYLDKAALTYRSHQELHTYLQRPGKEEKG